MSYKPGTTLGLIIGALVLWGTLGLFILGCAFWGTI